MEKYPDSRLSRLLQKIFPEPITSLTLSSGSNPGDNVIGKMLSVHLRTASGQDLSLVVKGLLPFGLQDPEFSSDERLSAQVMSMFQIFSTELAYFQRILPALEKFTPENFPQLPTPKYFYGLDDLANNGHDSCLVLEDLRPQGYRMADKMAGLTLEEVSLVLERIARFHAASYAYLETKQKPLLQQLRSGTTPKDDPLATHVFAKSGDFANAEHESFAYDLYFDQLHHLREIGRISPQLHEKILKFVDNPRQKILESSKDAAQQYFHTLIHGDLWVNNVLFKYDDGGKPKAVSFIDFQQCRYSSLFDELHYFIYTSTTKEWRRNNLGQCLDFYYYIFINALDTLGVAKPRGFSREEFHKSYKRFLGGAFVYAVIAVPFQVGIPPAPIEAEEGREATAEKEAETEVEASQDNGDSDRVKEFVGNLFRGFAGGLVAATKNSPEALDRLTDLCVEMEGLGVFDAGN